MKRLILPALLLLGFAQGAQAQETDTLRVKVNGTEIVIATDDLSELNDVDINAMINKFTEGMKEAKEEFQATMKDIDAREEAGEISEDQADEEREAAAEVFEEKVEALAENLEDWGDSVSDDSDWDTWSDQWEDDGNEIAENDSSVVIKRDNQVVIIDENGIRIEDSECEEDIIIGNDEDYYDQDEGYIGLHLGWNTLYNDDFLLSAGDAEVDFFNSWKFDLEFGHKVRLGQTSPLFFHYGVNFGWHSYRTYGSLMKFDDNGTPAADWQQRTDVSVSKTEFDISYFDVPLMLSLDLSGRDIYEGFNIGVGGYGGVRMNAERETTYKDFRGDEVEEDIDDHFLTNQWRYGLIGQIGYGRVVVTARYDLSPLFQDRFNTPDYHNASITVGLIL